jgi:hypothetical protein
MGIVMLKTLMGKTYKIYKPSITEALPKTHTFQKALVNPALN